TIDVDEQVSNVSASDYDSLVLPGGVINPDKLRTNDDALQFIRDFFSQGKPVSAICHAPQLLINAEVIENRKVTSYASIRKDLENAGAEWVDEEVVCEDGLTTSRKPDDLPAFCDKMVEEIREGKHEDQVVDA
ncbi:MAG: type 1 glutamine amidotransferase domain-containing protein, partial [Bacteroidota bacterium]